MNIEKIILGNYYIVKYPHGDAPPRIYKIAKRENDKEYPFEISAARYGVKSEDISLPKDQKDIKIIELLNSLE